MHDKETLWIIMPIYNEGDVLSPVVNEWLDTLRKVIVYNFVFCIIDDGSKDNSLEILRQIEINNKEIKVISKENSGHGQTCLYGYFEALKNKADWIFQIDSDGQCDPVYFEEFWKQRIEHKIIYGNRTKRLDGFGRVIISKLTKLAVFFVTGVYIRDPNVPYRLMHSSTLSFLNKIPKDFILVNILIAAIQQKYYNIKWIPIVFRVRHSQNKTINLSYFFKQGLILIKQLKSFTSQLTD